MDLIAHVSRQFEENAHATQASVELLAGPIALAVETLTETLFNKIAGGGATRRRP